MRYWEKAIASSNDQYYRMINCRGYANFLFTIGRVGDGREQYRKAITLSSSNDDFSKFSTAYTYRMWGSNEIALHHDVSAKEAFDKAEEAYQDISVENVRKFWLDELNRFRDTAAETGVAAKPPGAPPTAPTIGDFAKRWSDLIGQTDQPSTPAPRT